MEIFLIIIMLLLVILTVSVFIFMNKVNKNNKPDDSSDKAMSMLQNQINALTQLQNEKLDRVVSEVNNRLSENSKSLNQTISLQFTESQKSLRESNSVASKIIQEVTEKLTKLDETNKQVVGFAEQLQSLENILKNPKQRGILGEYFLETVLKNVLPPGSFQMQYKFKNGEIVDAAVFVKDKIIPIDSKFSLENYNRIVVEKDPVEKEKLEKIFKQDLKNRIEETSKYIRPEEGTMDFAFMFIPSEGIYYDLLINNVGTIKLNTTDLISFAFTEKHVIIVSPTSFLAYLQTVLQGLKALQIEESAQQIVAQVRSLQKNLNAFEENYDKVGKHLGTTVNAYNGSFKAFKRMDKDLFKLTGESITIVAEEVDKPLVLGEE